MIGRRNGRTVLAAVLLIAALSAPAAAQPPAEPEITDACGLGAHSVDQQPLPWLDICAAWFDSEVVGDVPELRVTLEVAGDLATRTDGSYGVSWRSGDCRFRLERHDDGGSGLESTGSGPAVELLATCEPVEQVDCDPEILEDLGFFCLHFPPEQRFDVSASYEEDGSRLSWALRFDGALADFAELHRPGSVLTATSAITGADVAGSPLYLSSCQRSGDDPWRCRSHVGDWVPEGRDHVVEG